MLTVLLVGPEKAPDQRRGILPLNPIQIYDILLFIYIFPSTRLFRPSKLDLKITPFVSKIKSKTLFKRLFCRISHKFFFKFFNQKIVNLWKLHLIQIYNYHFRCIIFYFAFKSHYFFCCINLTLAIEGLGAIFFIIS